MVVVDHGLTKGVILIPTQEKGLTAEKTAKLFIEYVFKRFGIPDKLISDRGVQFNSEFFQEFCRHLGMKSTMSTAYHPQTDGTTERFNQEIKLCLSIYCISNPHNWSSALPTLEFTHNSRPHADRKQSPFELIYGYMPPAIPQAYENLDLRSTKEKFNKPEQWRREALAAHQFA
jgi:transposase InsO family protein